MGIYSDGKLGPLTTKGDIRVFDGSDEVRLPIGPNTQVITADSVQSSGVKWAAAGGAGAVTREGGNTTEATTTSTTAVDLLSATGLSIGVTLWLLILVTSRKTAGAATAAGTGLKLNATVTADGNVGAPRLTTFSATDQAEARSGMVLVPPRVANYVGVGAAFGLASGVGNTAVAVGTSPSMTAAIPQATLTDVVIRGITTTSVTLGADELQALSVAAA